MATCPAGSSNWLAPSDVPPALRVGAAPSASWPDPAGGSYRIVRSTATNAHGEQWAHRRIRQIIADDRFAIVWRSHDNSGIFSLEVEPCYFMGLLDCFDDRGGKLVLGDQEIVPVEVGNPAGSLPDESDCFAGIVPRGSDPLDHLPQLNLTAEEVSRLQAKRKGGQKR